MDNKSPEAELHSFLKRNLLSMKQWQVNPYEMPGELTSQISLLPDPLLQVREFFFGRQQQGLFDLCQSAGFEYDQATMEDYVFHELGKARNAIRKHQFIMLDCLEMSEELGSEGDRSYGII